VRPSEARALRAGQAWAPLLLLPIAFAGLLDPVFADTLAIDEPWEAFCLAVSGLGIVLRVLVAGHEPDDGTVPDTTGLYSLVRHPLALGNFFIWTGLALFARSWPTAIGGMLVAAILCRRGMAQHDAWLAAQPGAWLQAWRRATPAVLPRWSSWQQPATGFSWRSVLDRESATLFATVAAFVLLEIAGEFIAEPLPQVEPAWAVLLLLAAAPHVLSRLLAWQSRAASAAAQPAPAAVEQDRWLLLLVVGFTALLAWDASGADLAIAHWFGAANGFPMRDNALFAGVLHEGGRLASWAAVAWIAIGIALPTGELRLLAVRERAWLLCTVVASVLVVALLKAGSTTTCPWDVAGFGGAAPYVSHWHLHVADGGPGHCFPAGHAAGGYALVAGFFAFRHRARRAALQWLLLPLAFGTVLGIGQQVRGAHFASHTLWSAWICCAVAWASATLFLRRPKEGPR
jgi:membrane-associated PAP2 superfamily phosphatase/protein-S-isoprenylcysteine O-methyltransferase Ste14